MKALRFLFLTITLVVFVITLSSAQGNSGNHAKKQNSTIILFDLTQTGRETSSRQINGQIAAIDNQIANLQEQKDTLQAELIIVQGLEPPNVEAVDYAIMQINSMVDSVIIVLEIQDIFALDEPDSIDVYNDANEIVNE